MKALSLHQPWASLIAIGAKRIETRHWPTSYRGPIAIHAAKRPLTAEELRDDDLMRFFPTYPRVASLNDLRAWAAKTIPLGAVVATAELYHCGLMVSGPGARKGELTIEAVPAQERMLGNYEPGRYGWGLEKVRALTPPIPARGAQGLWEWRTA